MDPHPRWFSIDLQFGASSLYEAKMLRDRVIQAICEGICAGEAHICTRPSVAVLMEQIDAGTEADFGEW